VVDKKTGERTPLNQNTPPTKGFTLKSFSMATRRKDVMAEVLFQGESATLHFDETYLRQVAAQSDSRTENGSAQAPAQPAAATATPPPRPSLAEAKPGAPRRKLLPPIPSAPRVSGS
jgi:hypothetical protein